MEIIRRVLKQVDHLWTRWGCKSSQPPVANDEGFCYTIYVTFYWWFIHPLLALCLIILQCWSYSMLFIIFFTLFSYLKHYIITLRTVQPSDQKLKQLNTYYNVIIVVLLLPWKIFLFSLFLFKKVHVLRSSSIT